eukprot:COSAG02_NODE_43076_length_378_cov_0.928315_1_plen_58_part_10
MCPRRCSRWLSYTQEQEQGVMAGADEVAPGPAGWPHQPHSPGSSRAVQPSFSASRLWG